MGSDDDALRGAVGRLMKEKAAADNEAERKVLQISIDAINAQIDSLQARNGGSTTVRTAQEQAIILGHKERLKEEAEADACTFWFVNADFLRSRKKDPTTGKYKPLEAFQVLQRLTFKDVRTGNSEDVLVKKKLTREKAFRAEYVAEFCAVSHRWESRCSPDTAGEQLHEIIQHVTEKEELKYVWFE